MAEINGYIKGVQLFFVGNEYERHKTAVLFAEKYGSTAEQWEYVMDLDSVYVECNLVQNPIESTWGLLYAPSSDEGITPFVMTRQDEDGKNIKQYGSRAAFWAAHVPSKNTAPVYRFAFMGQKKDVYNLALTIDRGEKAGAVVAEYPGWYWYDKGNDHTNALIDKNVEQQGDGLLASFMKFCKKEFAEITQAFRNLGEEVGQLLPLCFLKVSSENQTLGNAKITAGDNQGMPFLSFVRDTSGVTPFSLVNPGMSAYGFADSSSPQGGEVSSFGMSIAVDGGTDGLMGGLILNPQHYVDMGIVGSVDKAKLGVYVVGKTAEDLLTAYGETVPISTFAKQADFTTFQSHVSEALDFEGENVTVMPAALPLASTTERGGVKMAGKVDALADDATLAQTVDRLNTLVAYLKSAGLMSEN